MGRREEKSLAPRELVMMLGVYRGVFEQSLLLNENSKRPWNFLASLSTELLVVSLVLVIPLLYRDHLPEVHWKDIIVGPALSAPPIDSPARHQSEATNSAPAPAFHRPFHWDPKAGIPSEQASASDFTPEAPPSIGVSNLAGNNSLFGRFIANPVALPPSPAPETQKLPSTPLTVGGDVQMAKILRKVIPLYPPLARAARISGIVRLIGTIGKDGTIQNLQIVSGHPMLARAAVEAVQQWVYQPTLLNGNPVEVIAPIEVNFTLGQ
jgi:protein TonB